MLLSIAGNIHADYRNSSSTDSSTCISNACTPCNDAPCCNSCCDSWVLYGDLLYWRALQGGLECGCGPEIHHRWDLGYRIGLEYDPSCYGWDISAYWTHFHNHSHQGSDDEDFAHWKLEYDAIDIRFSYEISSVYCFSFTPFVGVRGVRIHEKLKAHFGGCDCETDSEDISFDQDHKERFWGVGPEIGLEAKWPLRCGFSLYGELGVGLLYGRNKINVHDYETIPNPTDDGACCVDREIHACDTFADFAVGIQWEKCFCNDIKAIFKLGWEHHRFYNFNQIGGYGDLCLDGAILSAGIKF
jgi:hypothetical protein